jgi:hypothetical protein
LAGRGDIKRFFDRYEEVKREVAVSEQDGQWTQKIGQDIHSLQLTLQAGLFHEDSLMVKSLSNTLTPEQFARYDAEARERRISRHRDSTLQAVAILHRWVSLRDEQRRELITLFTQATEPSRRPSPYEAQVLLLQLGRLAEEKLKQVFDENQLQKLHEQLAHLKQMEPMLTEPLPLDPDNAESRDSSLLCPIKKDACLPCRSTPQAGTPQFF